MSVEFAKTWHQAVSEGLISESMAQEHIQRAADIDWQYEPVTHSDIKGTLIRDGALITKVRRLLNLFQEAGRKVQLMSSDPSGSQNILETLGVTEFSRVIDKRDKTLEASIMERYTDPFLDPPDKLPFELLLDDRDPILKNSYVSYIKPRVL